MNSLQHYFAEAISSSKGLGKYANQDPDDPTTWQVGDILCGQAGYTMCLPRFYKIVKKTAKSFTCIRLEGKIVSGHKNGQWTEIATDHQDPRDTDQYTGRINKWGRVKIDDTLVHLWDGQPVHGDDMD